LGTSEDWAAAGGQVVRIWIELKECLAAYIFKTIPFAHKGVNYHVVAYQEPTDARLFVTTLAGGQPVPITYPDGFRATLVYSVDPITAVDFKQATGNSAVDELMATAQADITRLI
jgi:hypothetical protein